MLYQLYILVARLFDVYEVLIVVYCLMSWVPSTGTSLMADLRYALSVLVEPYLGFFRRIIPPFGMVDFSPVVAILALSVIQNVVLRLLL